MAKIGMTSSLHDALPFGWMLTVVQAKLVFRALRSSDAILTDSEEEQLAALRDALMQRIEVMDGQGA